MHPDFIIFGLALGLGLLVGMQRERGGSPLAGIRTFPIITLAGALAGTLAKTLGGWIIAAGLISVAAVFYAANLRKARDVGRTTEMSGLLMFLLGAYLAFGSRDVAVALGGVLVVLLHLKQPMHRFVSRMGERDFTAIVQFVVVALIILPLLPDRAYGPLNVLNPREIWTMVALMVGISLAAYIAHKLFGQAAGALLGGAIGGMISSTVTTIACARRAAESPDLGKLSSLVAVVASTVAFARLIIELAVATPAHAIAMIPPFALVLVVMASASLAVWFGGWGKARQLPPQQTNPADLKNALIFGALYAVVIVLVEAAKIYLPKSALYLVASLSGIADMDAITLSTSRLVETQKLAPAVGWKLIMLAAMANLLFKTIIAGAIAGKALFARLWLLFGPAFLTGCAFAIFWQ